MAFEVLTGLLGGLGLFLFGMSLISEGFKTGGAKDTRHNITHYRQSFSWGPRRD